MSDAILMMVDPTGGLYELALDGEGGYRWITPMKLEMRLEDELDVEAALEAVLRQAHREGNRMSVSINHEHQDWVQRVSRLEAKVRMEDDGPGGTMVNGARGV